MNMYIFVSCIIPIAAAAGTAAKTHAHGEMQTTTAEYNKYKLCYTAAQCPLYKPQAAVEYTFVAPSTGPSLPTVP